MEVIGTLAQKWLINLKECAKCLKLYIGKVIREGRVELYKFGCCIR